MSSTHSKPEYRQVKGFPDYEVGDDGSVVSTKWNKRTRLKTNQLKGGHLQVKLYKRGRGTSILVHHLVLEAFVGPCPPGLECRHLNGVPTDNRKTNLTWGTRVENQRDRITHGTANRGERTPKAILSEVQAVEILRRFSHKPKDYVTNAAKEYNVSRQIIYNLITRRTWRYLDDQTI